MGVGKGSAKPRVLFVGEAVTLAHVARPIALARTLDPDAFEVVFAAHPRFNSVLGHFPFAFRPIQSIPSEQFLLALAQGSPMYDNDTLCGYVQEDLTVLDEFHPDVVVGDFRLSLGVSARLAGVHYMAIVNAYWSPYAHQRFPMPELTISRGIGVPISRVLFYFIRPLGFAIHARPMNLTRQRFGMDSLGWDLRKVYSEADEVLYADVPEIVPTFDRPSSHHYIGPVLWSPTVPVPTWWASVPQDRPIVYVTLGTSGQIDLLEVILNGLADLPITVLAATAGRTKLDQTPSNTFIADYLPGEEAATRSCLVVCNGGSPTTQQALAAGVPVLGIPSNIDQYINMDYLQQAGAGTLLRASAVTPESVRAAVAGMLRDNRYAEKALALKQVISRYNVPRLFQSALRKGSDGRVSRTNERVTT